MTRVILTNKQTGQELPEAELVNIGPSHYEIRFDGTSMNNVLDPSEWEYREVRTFRNGDVLRRKDRSNDYVRYMYVVDVFEPSGQWLEINSGGSTHFRFNPSVLNDPEWEAV